MAFVKVSRVANLGFFDRKSYLTKRVSMVVSCAHDSHEETTSCFFLIGSFVTIVVLLFLNHAHKMTMVFMK